MVKRQKMIVAAVTAGCVAAGIVYLMYKRPQWRRQVVEVGRHLLNLAEGVIKRREAEALPAPEE